MMLGIVISAMAIPEKVQMMVVSMIEAAKKAFAKHGLPPDRLYYDSFEFGLDVPVRVLARAGD